MAKKFKMDAEMEELDEWACRAFNPDNHIRRVLPSGACARVSPEISPESLAALDRLAVLAAGRVHPEAISQAEKPF